MVSQFQIIFGAVCVSLLVGANSANVETQTTLKCYECKGDLCVDLKDFDKKIQQCEAGSKCLTTMNSEVQVVRRCTVSPEETCAVHQQQCSICEGNLCNFEVFPSDRLLCLQCESGWSATSCDIGSINYLKPCKNYKQGDQCFTAADEVRRIHRGCVSDNNQRCKDELCVKCSKNNCNNGGLEVPSTLKCIKCDASKGQECESGKVKTEPVTCDGYHNNWEKETCFSQNATKATTKRGCFLELPDRDQAECTASKNCHVCGTDGCNKIDNYSESKGFKCHVCSSTPDEFCAKYPQIMEPQICPITPNSFNEGPGCFVQRIKGTIVRDCLTSSKNNNLDLANCSRNVEIKGKNCIMCDTDSCNTHDAPGSATSIKMYSSLMAMSLLLIGTFL